MSKQDEFDSHIKQALALLNNGAEGIVAVVSKGDDGYECYFGKAGGNAAFIAFGKVVGYAMKEDENIPKALAVGMQAAHSEDSDNYERIEL